MQAAHFWVLGAPGAGVSTFIASLTDSAVSDQGSLTIEGVLEIHLHGVDLPSEGGVWQVDAPKPLGLIVMVDSTQPQTFPWVVDLPERINHYLPGTPLIIAYNKQDLPDAEPTLTLRELLPSETPIQVFYCVASQKSAAENVLLALIYQLLGR